ncbi:MAG: DUF721 domain-containing protein [Treponema sp.]|nr:DUF721 domain-containing protein [Treponema sp.]
MNEEEIRSFGDIINSSFKNISKADYNNSNSLLSIWEKVLLRIRSNINPNEGRNLASHSRVVDFKNGILLVEADHPGWIELLQLHKRYIINGLNMENRAVKVESLAFKLKGKQGNLFDPEEHKYSTEEVKEEIMRRAEEEEKKLNNFKLNDEKVTQNKELPPELASIFEDLRKNMLTNS